MRGKNLINQVSQSMNRWLENCVKIATLLYNGYQTLHWKVSSEISFRSKLEFCRILTKPLSAFGPGLCKELSPVPYFQCWCISLPFLELFPFLFRDRTIKDCQRHNRPKLHSNLNLNPDFKPFKMPQPCSHAVQQTYDNRTNNWMKWDEKILD